MKTTIAVTIAVLVAVGALLPQTRRWAAMYLAHLPESAPAAPLATTSPQNGLKLPVLEPVILTNILATPVGIEAWNAFDAYRAAAKSHDVKAISSLSYQLSPQCTAALANLSNASSTAPCYQLMDSVYFFTQAFKESDFKNVAYDERQAVIATDYAKVEGSNDPIKAVIYFVRNSGAMKVLGIRFCLGKEETANECVNTDSATRDTDQNGWWDDVEALFKKS